MSAVKKNAFSQEKRFDLPKDVSSKQLSNYYEEIKDIQTQTLIIFNFTKTEKLETGCYPLIHKIKNHILKLNGDFFSFGFSLNLISQLQNDGVIGLFNIRNEKPINKKKLDVNFIAPFISSTINTLNIQAGLPITSGAPQLKVSQEAQVDIVGVISLISKSFQGSISLCFPKNTFLKICNRLFNENHQEISSEIEDAAGELLNMIFGSAKAELNKNSDFEIQKALPTVISGTGLKLKQSKGPTLVVPFQSEAGPFHLEIELVDNK